jgi:hypothetical protein
MKKHHAVIARSGIQYYLDTELQNLMLTEIPREYKNQKVFSVYRPSFVLENAKEMFKNAPIRKDHKWIYHEGDPEILGHIADDVMIKKHKGEVALCATLDIDDDGSLPKYKELSPGYLSDNKWQPGVAPNGEPYEILCTGINSINHLAIVHEARGGKDMKILDGGTRMVHSGLIRAIKKRLHGVFDGNESLSFEGVVDEIATTIQNIDDEGLKAKTASLVGFCDDLPDSEEKEKLLRYIADIPLLKEEDEEVVNETLKCIKDSYNALDSDANSDVMNTNKDKENTMPTEENKPVEEPKKDELPQTPSEPSAPTAEPKKDEAPVAEPKADGCGGDATAKLADALDAISKKLDALLEAKAEPKKDEPSVAEPNKDEAPAEPSAEKTEGVGDSMPSLPQYTQSLGAIEKGYNLDDAFNRLKGRR